MTARSLHLLFAFSVGVVLLLVSCSKKQVIPVGEFESYQDPAYGFGISYPKDWIKDPQVGRRVRIYSSFDARDRFLDPTGSKQAGVYIEVGIDTTKGQTLDAYAEDVEKDMAGIWTVKPEEQTTLEDLPAIKIPFTIPIDSRNQVVGYRIAASKDNVITYVEASGFSGVFDDYKLIIDTSLTTVRFGRLMTAKSKEDISKPSETFETYKGEFFDLEYPSNFEYRLPKKPNTDIVMDLKGYREDCTMKIEVSDAKNLTVDKVVAQNEGNLLKAGYRTKKKASVTIDGNKAALIDLTYAKGDVDSRAYYTVKNNKMYFIFLTWYRPQAKVYVPIFEKMVSSLKLK
jgi:chitodextrinase